MAVWGKRNFENDEATDFVTVIVERGVTVNDLYFDIESVAAIQEKEVPEYGPDLYDASKVLVAIELLAALKGNLSNDFPDILNDWLIKNSQVKVKEEEMRHAKRANSSNKKQQRIERTVGGKRRRWQMDEHT